MCLGGCVDLCFRRCAVFGKVGCSWEGVLYCVVYVRYYEWRNSTEHFQLLRYSGKSPIGERCCHLSGMFVFSSSVSHVCDIVM